MSTAVVKAEIQRFLRSSAPEVLCISGAWGVGKTFSWQKFLREAEAARQLGNKRYSYVSLFGVNSLAELRHAIVESTIVAEGPLTSPDAASLHDMLRRGERFARQSRPALEIAAGFFRMKDAGDALYRAAFLTVRDQLICFDDLERAGKALEMRDILGLASMLREQRGCKVVLLLNKEQAEPEQAKELDRQLEKVVDSFLIFQPTSAEATAIAIEGADPTAEQLRAKLVALDITNMRVMKKIERWARLLVDILADCDEGIRAQAVATVTLAGWCFLQRDIAPNLDFVRSFNSMSGLFGRKDIPPEEQKWRELLRVYGYGSTDELDGEIIGGVVAGYFRRDELRTVARDVQERRERESRDNSFSQAWSLYHHRLTVDDEAVLDAMYTGALENLTTITPVNMNSAIRFLRRYGREEQASELVGRYVDANRQVPKFFSRWNRFMGDDPIDPELLAAMEGGRAAIIDARDPAAILKGMASTNSFNPSEDVALLSKLDVAALVRLFDDNEGDDVKGMMEWAERLANQPGADVLRANQTAAIEQIAARSPMRADRLRSWGVLPSEPESAADEQA